MSTTTTTALVCLLLLLLGALAAGGTASAAPTCTKAFGRAFFKKRHEPGRLNLLDRVNTNLAAPQKLVVALETGAIRYRLVRLEEATCEGAPGARDFHGKGAAAKGHRTGFILDFHIKEVPGGFKYEASLTRGGGIVLTSESAPLAKLSKAQPTPQTIE